MQTQPSCVHTTQGTLSKKRLQLQGPAHSVNSARGLIPSLPAVSDGSSSHVVRLRGCALLSAASLPRRSSQSTVWWPLTHLSRTGSSCFRCLSCALMPAGRTQDATTAGQGRHALLIVKRLADPTKGIVACGG